MKTQVQESKQKRPDYYDSHLIAPWCPTVAWSGATITSAKDETFEVSWPDYDVLIPKYFLGDDGFLLLIEPYDVGYGSWVKMRDVQHLLTLLRAWRIAVVTQTEQVELSEQLWTQLRAAAESGAKTHFINLLGQLVAKVKKEIEGNAEAAERDLIAIAQKGSPEVTNLRFRESTVGTPT